MPETQNPTLHPICMAGIENPPMSKMEFQLFRDLIYSLVGISLAGTKHELLRLRLRKQLLSLQFADFKSYYDYIKTEAKPQEIQEFINVITTNTTSFFREPHHFEFLNEKLFPRLVAEGNTSKTRQVRIWSAACSSGEEPYSIAATARDFFFQHPKWRPQVLASDVNNEVLTKAKAGIYHLDQIVDLDDVIRKRHFLRGVNENEGRVIVHPATAGLVSFQRINLIDPLWPITSKFHVILCRNVMIYFDQSVRQALVSRLIKHLLPGGFLILGHSEHITWSEEVRAVGKNIYQFAPTISPGSILDFSPSEHLSGPAKGDPSQKCTIVVGEVLASADDVEISTLLGSCVAVCLYDPIAKVGGMNHFLVPCGSNFGTDEACYGVHAMERLVNALMQLGGKRHQMVAKLFGGSQILKSTGSDEDHIGKRNVDFVRAYLAMENIPIVDERTGGTRPHRVTMIANSGAITHTVV